MSTTFTKLFSSITESTIWVEPYATRIVWVSMLAMADRRGRVFAAIPGLARRAGVTLEECEAALTRFQQPDKYSRTPDNEGRRIEPIDGGWRLLNYEKYREIRDEESRREYQRDWDRKHRNKSASDNSDKNRPRPTKAEAEAEAEKQSQDQAAPQVSATVAPPAPAARAAPPPGEFPKPNDPRVQALHGIALASGVRMPALDAQQWVADGLTEAQLLTAIGRAKAKKPGQAVPIGFLQCFVVEVRNETSGYDAKGVAERALARIAASEAAEAEASRVAH